uniref:FAST kinase domain-containing protein 4 n=1 Tax=Monodelphis domestica TaxID=13616 RepID=F6YQS9_MONDO
MASRLMQRCICLLATHQVSPLTVISRVRLAKVPCSMMTTTHGSTVSTLDNILDKEPVFTPYPWPQKVDQQIEKARSPEEILELLDGRHKLHHNHTAIMVIKLSRLLADKHQDRDLIIKDNRVQKLFHSVDKQVSSIWHGTLMSLLRSLYTLQLRENSRCLRSVEQEVRWRLRRVKYKNLVFLAETSIPYMQEQASKELLTELLMYLERRWTEIDDCRTVVTLMTKVGHLSEPLMGRLEDKHMLNKADSFTPLQLSNMILAFARLNFHPEQEEQFFSLVHKKLEPELANLSPILQVDVVWSLCVLQQVQEAQLQGVLCQEFHKQFLDSKFPQNQNICQKLVHINATAQLEHPKYIGPYLPLALPTGLPPPNLHRKMTPMQKDLQDIMKGWLGSEDKVRFGETTQYGWELDAELVLDVENQPLPMKNFIAPHLAQPTGTQPLPPGAKRLAFLRWEFPNFNSRSKDLLGRFVMARRHLQAAGLLVVDVPYYEWLELKSEWQKGAYLKDKMGKTVAEDLAK